MLTPIAQLTSDTDAGADANAEFIHIFDFTHRFRQELDRFLLVWLLQKTAVVALVHSLLLLQWSFLRLNFLQLDLDFRLLILTSKHLLLLASGAGRLPLLTGQVGPVRNTARILLGNHFDSLCFFDRAFLRDWLV